MICDAAQVIGPHGPGVAPVGRAKGAYIAHVIAAKLARKPLRRPFRYRDFGNLATIGRHEAVADFGWLRLTGRLAWLVWSVAHIYFLIGFRNRTTTLAQRSGRLDRWSTRPKARTGFSPVPP